MSIYEICGIEIVLEGREVTPAMIQSIKSVALHEVAIKTGGDILGDRIITNKDIHISQISKDGYKVKFIKLI